MLLIFKKSSTEMFYFPYVIHVRERLMSECFETHPLRSRITWMSVATVAIVATPGLLQLPATSHLSFYGYWVSVVVADVIMVSSSSCVTSHLVAT